MSSNSGLSKTRQTNNNRTESNTLRTLAEKQKRESNDSENAFARGAQWTVSQRSWQHYYWS